MWVLNSSVYGANPDILWRSDSERLLQMDTSIDWGTCSISLPAFLPLYPKSEKRNRVRGCRVGWMEVKCVAASHWSLLLEHTSNTQYTRTNTNTPTQIQRQRQSQGMVTEKHGWKFDRVAASDWSTPPVSTSRWSSDVNTSSSTASCITLEIGTENQFCGVDKDQVLTMIHPQNILASFHTNPAMIF